MAISDAIPNLTNALDKCAACPIRNRAVCSYSTPPELSRLETAKFYQEYESGTEIVGEGEPIKALGSIVSGVVALHKMLDDGRRQMVGLLFPSDFIGRPLREFAPYEATAVTPVRMCMFHRRQFEDILKDSTSLERRLLEMTLDELDAARDWMVLLGRKTSRERLSSFLMFLARRHGALERCKIQNGLNVPIPLTREAIADYLGLTIETVSRQFTIMRKAGLIDTPDRRSFTLMDVDTLSHQAGEEDGIDDDQATG